MSSSISGVFLHVFSSCDDKKVNEISKQRAQLRELLEVATNHLRDCHYYQAKINFTEAKTYMKNCKKRDEMNLPDELDFYINVVICYSFTMELDSIKDITKDDFKKEDQSMKNEINGLVKKYPKRHFPLFLRLLYSFKKECWREAIYYCELVQNFKIYPEEEAKYKSTPIFSKHLIPELDIDYCNDVVHNIEEAAIYGLVEKVAKLDDVKNSKSTLAGFNWVNLWSKDCNETIIKRLRSYKKPMSSFQLHKLFHTEILPKFYTLNKSVGKSLFCYYKKEFMYQCEECLRAKLQQESRNELFGRLCDHSSDDDMSIDDSDLFDTEDDEDNNDIASNNGDVSTVSPNAKEKGKDKTDRQKSADGKSETKMAQKEKEKNTVKRVTVRKSQQTQTEKIKIGHRYVQTECSSKRKSIAIQTDGSKAKKQEKVEKHEESKCIKCKDHTKLFSVLDEIKNQLTLSNVEMKKSLQDQLNDLLNQMKQIEEEKNNLKNNNDKYADKSFEVIQSKQMVAKLEKQILRLQDTYDKEKKDLGEKNVCLQKILVDQINDKYLLYKNIYSGLENNCRVIIANVAELQNFLTNNSFPNVKDNQLYLGRWEKTLLDLQRKNGQLKTFYKNTKADMLHLSEFKFLDWPEIAEIPIEAFGFLFESLKQSVKTLGIGQHKSPDQKMITETNMPPHIPGGRMYSIPVASQNIGPYMEAGLRYGTYQQPPPPIPMPPVKIPLSTWSQNSNSNAQMYPANQWPSNPMMDFFTNFPSNSNNDVSSEMETGVLNTLNFNQGIKSPILPPSKDASISINKKEKNNPPEKGCFSSVWDVDNVTSNLGNIPNETNSTNLQEDQKENMDMNDYFSSYVNHKTMSTASGFNQSMPGGNAQNVSSGNEATVKVQQRENLIQNGFWALDKQRKDFGDGRSTTKDQNKDTGATGSLDNPQELFQYLRVNCSDVDNDELISTILKVLKKFNGSFSNIPKTDILKEVKSSILSGKRGVWTSPKSPLVDWETDIADSHCSICFDDLNQRPKCVLPCKHQYHKNCISEWLRTNSVCPICRVHSVIDEDYPPLSKAV